MTASHRWRITQIGLQASDEQVRHCAEEVAYDAHALQEQGLADVERRPVVQAGLLDIHVHEFVDAIEEVAARPSSADAGAPSVIAATAPPQRAAAAGAGFPSRAAYSKMRSKRLPSADLLRSTSSQSFRDFS